MPYLSKNEIEQIAIRVIRAYKKLPALQDMSVNMILPGLLAKDLLGLKVEYHTLSLDGRTLGCTTAGPVDIPIFDDLLHPEMIALDGKTILLDPSLKDPKISRGRWHFTFAHEIAHQVMKMLYPKEYLTEPRRRRVYRCSVGESSENWEERQADRLAAAMLMPEEFLRKNMLVFGLGEKMYRVNPVFESKEFRRFSALAEYMIVSKQALAIRMKQLGLLEVDELRNPYAAADIIGE